LGSWRQTEALPGANEPDESPREDDQHEDDDHARQEGSQQRQPAEGEGANQFTRGHNGIADPRGEHRGLQAYKSRARLNQAGRTAPGDDG
jgi:hypothetical protein